MAYETHPHVDTPSDDTVIWRYMDIGKCLFLLEQGGLYFALTKELGDSWEAVMARRYTDSIANAYGPAVSGHMVSLYNAFTPNVGVNCWFQGPDESVAMWSLYTNRSSGVAIRSTVGKLKQSFASAPESVFLGSILYEDHQKPPSSLLPAEELNPLRALLQKRPCYKHECELRALTHIQPPSLTRGTILGQIAPFPDHGVVIKVNLQAMVESITLGPDFPAWAKSLLTSALARASVAAPLVDSMLLQPPVVSQA